MIGSNMNYTYTMPIFDMGSGVTNGMQQVIITDGTGLQYGYQADLGMQQQQQNQMNPNPVKTTRKRIGPKLYFRYVKSKLTKVQQSKLKSRLNKLQKLVKDADEVGQKALYEEFSKMLVVAVRESEAAACGFDVYVNKKDVDKYMYTVTESDDSSLNPVNFRTLEEFPRPVPSKVQKTIKSVRSKGLFDQLWVLYLDYTKEQIKSTKEKIREKDPILFGSFSYDPNRLYFIADWVDEHCDLTLSKFVDALKKEDSTYETSQIGDISPEYLDRIKNEIKERDERMKNTNPSNFRDKMAQEDKAELDRLRAEAEKLRTEAEILKKDRAIAAERRAEWREEASREEGHENLIDPITPKKPWYKRIFG